MEHSFIQTISSWWDQLGIHESWIIPLSIILAVFISIISLWMMLLCLSRIVEPIVRRCADRTSVTWDDTIFRHEGIRWFWWLIVGIIAYYLLPYIFGYSPTVANVVREGVRVGLVLVIMMFLVELVKSIFIIIADRDKSRKPEEQYADEIKYEHSLKGLQQMFTIIICGISIILVISILIGKDPVIIFSGLGAMAAVLMLIFQDSILGVVAGIQLTANDMLKPGDWITVPKFDANGIVQQVTLATVKIKNWDNTIVTIPPYKLITEGFQNWRPMQLSNGRRVTRSFNIDINTVRFASADELAQWRSTEWGSRLPEGDEVVNLHAFRLFLDWYISTIPTLAPKTLYMVRELEPSSYGIPVEMYYFTTCTEWRSYEIVQADALDYVLAKIQTFGLRAHQLPTDYASK